MTTSKNVTCALVLSTIALVQFGASMAHARMTIQPYPYPIQKPKPKPGCNPDYNYFAPCKPTNHKPNKPHKPGGHDHGEHKPKPPGTTKPWPRPLPPVVRPLPMPPMPPVVVNPRPPGPIVVPPPSSGPLVGRPSGPIVVAPPSSGPLVRPYRPHRPWGGVVSKPHESVTVISKPRSSSR